MSGNLSLLTVLFIMCYFIKKGGNYAVTTITRAREDYFKLKDVSQDCLKYGATREQHGICKCEPTSSTAGGSVFLRDQSKLKLNCKDDREFMEDEHCQMWETKYVEVIDTERTNSYPFNKFIAYSYQLEPLISYRNSTTGQWQFFNLSGNVLMLQNVSDPTSRLLQIKVTQVSPKLKKLKGHVMKLGLKRFHQHNGNNHGSCLLFKAKGEIHFPLNCSVSVDSTTSTPSIAASAITTTLATSPTANSPTIIVTPTITCTSCTATITTPSTPKTPDPLPPVVIAVIVIGGTVLCLSLICTLVLVYRYTYICRRRGLQARNPGHDFDVIRNPGAQTYRIQEEPLYAEVPDILPFGKGSAGSSTNECEENATVLLNTNLYEARFSVARRTTEPLPPRPELAGNTNTQVDAGAVYQNDKSGAIGEGTEDAIVFKNPEVEASFSSLPRLENDFSKFSEVHEPERQSIGDHQHHVEDDIDNSTVHHKSDGTSDDHYQELQQGKRPRSMFICPSCNDNPVYQRLSMPHSCPHGANDKPKENRESYESLSGLGLQESVYDRPSQTTEEPAAEDKGNRNSEEGEGRPEYHTLEQEEAAFANDYPAEPGNHDYNVLEGPGETGDEVDERLKDSISRDPDQTSEDSDSSLEPSKILNMEDNPAYAKPWKAKGDPELPLEPSDCLNIEHNPAYSTPWKTKTAEPCLKRRTYSL